ncbi:phage tail protein [Streptomyces sp. BBFR2]|uniref:phage tail protein n=1 Tax=Streptomyces sp. BBFR2 TaxID=3372854 RepID=UPI0037DA31C4
MLPDSIPTVTVTGRFLAPNGRPLSGAVTFRAPAQLTFPEADVILGGPVVAQLDAQGQIEATLPATDAPDMDPVGWSYTVAEALSGIPNGRTYNVLLPAAAPLVDLADIAPTDPSKPNYIPVPGPEGPRGEQGESAYEVARAAGFEGTPADWLASLIGPRGEQGPQGERGEEGPPGTDGAPGADGLVQSVNGKSAPAITLTAADVDALPSTAAGIPGGVAQLDAAGHVPTAQLPESTGGGAVDSVNGQTGAVQLTAADVGALDQATADARYVRPADVPVQSVNARTGAVVLAAADVGALPASARGTAGGVAALGSDGRVPAAQLPAPSGARNVWTPQSLGFQAWSVDPAAVANPAIKAAVVKRVYLSGINITEPTSANAVTVFARGWAGSAAVPAARFYAGIYDETGKRIATSAQVSNLPAAGQAASTAPGAKNNHIGAVPIPLTATATLAPGRYWAAFLLSAGSATDFYYMHVQNESPSAPANFFLGTTFQRAWCLDGATSLPATVDQATGEVGLDPAVLALATI